MQSGVLRRSAAFVLLAIAGLSVAGCTPAPEGNDRDMTSQTQDAQEPEIATAIEESSANIVSARAEHVRSGLGVSLEVTFHMATETVTAEELDAVLAAVASRLPEGIVLVQVTARDEGVNRIPVTEPAKQLGLPELSIKREGIVVLSPAALRELYAE